MPFIAKHPLIKTLNSDIDVLRFRRNLQLRYTTDNPGVTEGLRPGESAPTFSDWLMLFINQSDVIYRNQRVIWISVLQQEVNTLVSYDLSSQNSIRGPSQIEAFLTQDEKGQYTLYRTTKALRSIMDINAYLPEHLQSGA